MKFLVMGLGIMITFLAGCVLLTALIMGILFGSLAFFGIFHESVCINTTCP